MTCSRDIPVRSMKVGEVLVRTVLTTLQNDLFDRTLFQVLDEGKANVDRCVVDNAWGPHSCSRRATQYGPRACALRAGTGPIGRSRPRY